MWLISTIVAGLLFTASSLLTRKILKGKKDAWVFSFYYSAVGALVSLPFIIGNFKASESLSPWILLVVVGVLITSQNFLSFKSSTLIPASIGGTITKFRPVWVFVLGLILSLDVFNINKFIGLILTVTAGIILVYKSGDANKKGIFLAFSSTFFYAVVIILYQTLFKTFNSPTLTFFIFIIPAIFNFLIIPNRITKIKEFYKQYRFPLIITCMCGGLANLAMNYSLSIGNSTVTLVIIEAFLILTLVGESIFLKEKENMLKKIIATLLAVLGAIIIRLA